MKCPGCGSRNNVHRSHRKGGMERTLSYLTFHRPFRCHQCMVRFWRPIFMPYRRGRARSHRRR